MDLRPTEVLETEYNPLEDTHGFRLYDTEKHVGVQRYFKQHEMVIIEQALEEMLADLRYLTSE